MSNPQGKTLAVFFILILILLASSTAIGFYLYNKEVQVRKAAESDLEASRTSEFKLQVDLKEIRRQLTVAKDKNKEADDKINNLMDEIELNEGLKKEMKAETASLKEALEALKREKEKIKTDTDDAQKKYVQLQELFKAEQDKSNNLQNMLKGLEESKAQMESQVEQMKSDLKANGGRSPEEQVASQVAESKRQGKVELDKIVVNSNDGARGRVLSIDKEAEFIVCSLGVKNGVKSGDIISVYRGEEYLGDVKVSRVQEELSAADIIPPFSSRKVRKNDIVVFKP